MRDTNNTQNDNNEYISKIEKAETFETVYKRSLEFEKIKNGRHKA